MAQVYNLRIERQNESKSLFARWEFQNQTTIVTPQISVGGWVRIKGGVTRWYNGARIDSWVLGQEWQVIEIRGARVVINSNRSGSNHIMSPININDIEPVGGGSSSVTVDSVDHYTVKWAYDTGNGIWFDGGSSDVKEMNSGLYNPPENSLRVRVTVTPVSKTRDVNGQQTPYWSGSPVSSEWDTAQNPPEVPPTPTVKIEKYTLTATVDNIQDARSDEIVFEVYDTLNPFNSGTVTVKAAMASYQCSVNAGGNYRVRARSANLYGNGKFYSNWSDFSSPVGTIPSPPTGITKIQGTSSTSVYLEWSEVNSAETYTIEYTTELRYFDNASSEVTSVTGIEFNHHEITGLEDGDEYFFRVQAVNKQGESAFTEPKSIVIGKKPAAPTTWSSVSTVIVGEPLNLYWVHNSQDGSRMKYAEIEFNIGGKKWTETIHNDDPEDPEVDDTNEIHSYAFDTKLYKEGDVLEWRVRTSGITNQYGDFSIMRKVTIYAPPTLELSLTNQEGDIITTLKEFPFYVKALAGPKTQVPTGYHLTITANGWYETVDSVGRPLIVNTGDAVYDAFIDTSDALLVRMSADNIDLQNGISYTVTVLVSMNSGLTTSASKTLDVVWEDATYNLDAEIAIDQDNFIAYVTPYARDFETSEPIDTVTLAVYRREFDGTYLELAKGIDATRNTVITDPHPALDYARYRIVATDIKTGAVSFYDPPAYPMGGVGSIIQWDEIWESFDVTDADAVSIKPQWVGSMLKLPFNVSVSDNIKTDSVLVDYIGRAYPVSYYGTKISSSSTWTMDIPKEDKETIYALRRLSIYKGDVYVRESSGSGYWANVSVSYSHTHNSLVVPVTLSITRVAGGA